MEFLSQHAPGVTVGSYALLLVLALAVLLWVLFRLLAALVRLFFALGGSGSDDRFVRLLAFAGATALYPDVLTYAVRVAYAMAEAVLRSVPGLGATSTFELWSRCQSYAEKCLPDATRMWIDVWTQLSGRIVGALDLQRAPVVSAVFFCAVWALLSLVLGAAKSGVADGAGSPDVRTRWSAGWTALRGSISAVTWRNAALLLVLCLASYLSITAIIAVPILTADPARETPAGRASTGESLRERLKNMLITPEQFVRDFPESLPAPPKWEPPETAANEAPTAEAQWLQSQFRLFVADQARAYDDLVAAWGQLRVRYRDRQSELVEQATRTHELVNLYRVGERERIQHLLDIDAWFQEWLTLARNHLNDCRSAMAAYAGALALVHTALGTLSRSPPGAGPMPLGDGSLSQARSSAEQQCRRNIRDTAVPRRADLGSTLGPIGVATNWLLKSESLPLTLIVGLVGFGLLGAACSTFIRRRSTRRPGEPWVDDPLAVVVQGTSAAIVVFLAVYGGLAVFAAPSAEPNPYVVLFACLVAAVYSEDVWSWARTRLGGGIAGKQGTDKSR